MRWDRVPARYAVAKARSEAQTKYRSVRTQVDGIWFDSKKEAARYSDLKTLENMNLLSNLKVHPAFPITYNETYICTVILDFAYDQDGRRVYEDAKGMDLGYSRLKRKLVEAFYGIKVELV